ncbi:NAD-dependent epimerase/dehydratase family protein [Candidatus Cryosericum septentrionale]|jgi:UDP-glucose 4-epimerase|uniref:NAD-dependent epimerase/dehydratase family protein n=1 Tax=Candidatus Cryosericum septentrionale TaxID=2290913 RepID=A0A398DKB8_9BACT|nr:NAD-dependent epimerase/dehydratase family protein [Candidatus Cryosericum septentrionale]
MNCMVTSGAGFIGSHIIDGLVARGCAVTVFDNLSSGKRQNLGVGVTIAVGNVRDPRAVAAALTPCTDAVFHLAAQIDVRRAITVPATDMQVNVGGIMIRESGSKSRRYMQCQLGLRS